MGNAMAEMLDTFGVPEHFATHVGKIEDAGNGMMRVIHCIQRNGVLMPVCTLVRPASAVLMICPELRDFAIQIMCQTGDMLAH